MFENGQIYEISSDQNANTRFHTFINDNVLNEQYNINNLSIPEYTDNIQYKTAFFGDKYNYDNYNFISAETIPISDNNTYTNYNYNYNNINNITENEISIVEPTITIINDDNGIPLSGNNVDYIHPGQVQIQNNDIYNTNNIINIPEHIQLPEYELNQIGNNVDLNFEENNSNNIITNSSIMKDFENDKNILKDIIKINKELNSRALNESDFINRDNQNENDNNNINNVQSNNNNIINENNQINNNPLMDSLISDDSSSSDNNDNNNNNIDEEEINQNNNQNEKNNHHMNLFEQMNDNDISNFLFGDNNIQNNSSIKNNHENNNNKKNFFSRYTKAIGTGLVNLGDTSYLNAVLFLLGNIRNLPSFFLKPKNIKYITDNVKTMPLSNAFQELFLHLYPYPEKQQDEEAYNPKLILYVLSILNIVYQSKKRRNPNNLISFILETLHSEINSLKNNNVNLKPNIYDKDNVIKYGVIRFRKTNNSIISNLFNWFEIKESKCNECNKPMYNLNTFNIFELDILGCYTSIKKQISIYDCFKYFCSTKQHNFFCNNCRTLTNMNINSKFFCSSNFFVFSLDRNDLDEKYMKIPFFIDEEINVSNYMEKKSKTKGIPLQFKLIGIVSFNTIEQKYISFCMSPVDGHWYVYNDEKIVESDIKLIINLHNNNINNNLDFIPCILVYKRI